MLTRKSLFEQMHSTSRPVHPSTLRDEPTHDCCDELSAEGAVHAMSHTPSDMPRQTAGELEATYSTRGEVCHIRDLRRRERDEAGDESDGRNPHDCDIGRVAFVFTKLGE